MFLLGARCTPTAPPSIDETEPPPRVSKKSRSIIYILKNILVNIYGVVKTSRLARLRRPCGNKQAARPGPHGNQFWLFLVKK